LLHHQREEDGGGGVEKKEERLRELGAKKGCDSLPPIHFRLHSLTFKGQ